MILKRWLQKETKSGEFGSLKKCIFNLIIVLIIICATGCIQNNVSTSQVEHKSQMEYKSQMEHKILGPYEVSFNLSTDMDYFINIGEVSKRYGGDDSRQSLNYPFTITSNAYNAKIALIKWAGPVQTRFDNEARNTIKELKDLGYYNVSKAEIPIDNTHQAILVHGKIGSKPSEFWRVYYWPINRPDHHTMCIIESNYPQEITQNLLTTFHVEIHRE
jgi:hypothetical protein